MPYVALDSFDTDTLDCLYCKVTGINGKFVSGYDDLPALVAAAALLAWFAMCFVLRPLLRLKNDVEVRGPADWPISIRHWCTRKCGRWLPP